MYSQRHNPFMPKRPSKQKVTPKLATPAMDALAPGTQPTKPAPNKAKPPGPTKKQDVKDIERADSEGMAQPQGLEPKSGENPAAVAPGRLGKLKGGKAKVARPREAKREALAKKTAAKRSKLKK
jgi:hypothetical protein